MNKEGQFFLIAAVVIVGLVITLAAVNISTKTSKEDVTVYDLSEEIDYESNELINSGVYQNIGERGINQSVISLARNYSAANPGTDIMIVYGNRQSLTGVLFSDNRTGFVGGGGGARGPKSWRGRRYLRQKSGA
jgi:hypothetical protein